MSVAALNGLPPPNENYRRFCDKLNQCVGLTEIAKLVSERGVCPQVERKQADILIALPPMRPQPVWPESCCDPDVRPNYLISDVLILIKSRVSIIYRDGKVVAHEGAWLHGKDHAQAGMMMPGECIVGAAYYQEYVPDQAMDRGRIQDTSATIKIPAGKFSNCLRVWEENPLDGDSETKTFAPGIGLVQDEGLLLVKHGFVGK